MPVFEVIPAGPDSAYCVVFPFSKSLVPPITLARPPRVLIALRWIEVLPHPPHQTEILKSRPIGASSSASSFASRRKSSRCLGARTATEGRQW